jgi:hypothetical protein
VRSRTTIGLFLFAFVFALSTSHASAQTVKGTLIGHVLDSSGAVMPNVKVTAKNEQTGTVRDAATNAEGYYLVSFLPIGSYTVTAALSGFRTVEKKGVVVELNKTTVSDFALEPAGVTATVEVKAGEIPLIETTVGELKHSLDARAVEDTPLPGRNFISLVEQIPGFQNAPWIGSSNNPTNSTGSYVALSGTGSRSTTFQIDGVNNDDSSENQNRQNVNISSIGQFQVLTNAYAAEFGRAGGAVVLVQTKSGTNSFQGDLYDFIQNDIFNANGFFNNQRGVPRPVVRRNQYGGTLGGPLWKGKLFFFASGERVSNVGSTSISRWMWLPSDGPRACNPGEVARPGGNANPARPGGSAEPLGNYCVDPATHPHLSRDLAFMKAVMDLWKTPELSGKTPNDPGDCGTLISSGRANRCVRVDGLPLTFPDSDYSGKLDWLAAKNTTMALRYQYSRQIRQSPRIVFGDNFGTANNRQYNIGFTATHVFSARQTGEFRYGFGNRSTNQAVTDGDMFPTQFAPQLPIIRFGNTLTNVGFPGTIIGTSANVPISRHQQDHQFVYNHTIGFTRHTLRMGVDQRFQSLDDVANATNRGFWRFDTTSADVTNIKAPFFNTATGKWVGFTGWEQFLLGIDTTTTGVTFFQRGYGDPFAENRFEETNLYVQDDLRLVRNLTLNLGVRWEGVSAPKEIHNRFSYGYKGDFNNVEPRFGFAWTPDTRNAFLGKFTGGPGKLVIRGGFGIAHSRVFQSIFSQSGLNFRAQPPNGFFGDFSNPAPATNEISDPSLGFVFAPGVASRSTEPACSQTAAGCKGVKLPGGRLLTSLLLPDKGFHLPYVQQWNLTIERQLPWRMALQIGYNGNRGIGLPFDVPLNTATFPMTSSAVLVDVGGRNFQPAVFDQACLNDSDPNCPQGALTSFSALSSATDSLAQKGIFIINGVPHGYISLATARITERRPDPYFSRNVALRNFGWSYYHAMTLKVTKATSHGLTFRGFWVWSKAIDTGSEATTTFVDFNTPPGLRNPARSLRGLSSFDNRHRVVFSYSYQLPWMKSQQGVLGRIVGGWILSGVTTFQSGNPFTVTAGYDVNLDGEGGDRPGISDPSFLYTSVDNGRPQNPCPTTPPPGTACRDSLSQLQLPGTIFIPPQAGSTGAVGGNNLLITPGQDGPGTIGRNTFFSEGMKNFDMAVSKSIHIREAWQLQLRMEWYNLFNRTMFDLPSGTVISSTAVGRISSQRNPFNYVNAARENGSRMGQLAIRFIF